MHRHQFNGGDAKLLQVVNRCWMHQASVGTAQFNRNVRMPFRETFDVEFVDDGFVPGAL